MPRERLVIVDTKPSVGTYVTRGSIRTRVLAMQPVDPTIDVSTRHALTPRPRGAFWMLVGVNGMPIMLRAIDRAGADEARHDARELLQQADQFVIVPVTEPETGARSWWVALEGNVVLVFAKVWRTSETGGGARTHQMALQALRSELSWRETGREAGASDKSGGVGETGTESRSGAGARDEPRHTRRWI